MKSPGRVALLTNTIPLYRVSLLEALSRQVEHLRIMVSIREYPGRDWHLYWGELDVVVSRTITIKKTFNNVHGFQDSSDILIPFDTFWSLLKFKPNVIVSSEFGTRTIFSTLYKILFRDAKLIVWATLSEHTEVTQGKVRLWLRRFLVRFADGFFVNGASGERYIRGLGYRGDLLEYVPYTIDNGLFLGRPCREPAEFTRLLFIGQIIERKGLLPFLKELKKWCELHPSREVQFVIAGSGNELDHLRAFHSPGNLTLVFPGNIASNSLPKFYQEADIYVFPTLADEWGVVVNEALISGLPILASSKSQAVDELVQDNITGWIFDPAYPDEMYSAIDRALSTSVEAMDEMRRKGIDSILPLTAEVVATRMASAVHRLLRPHL